MTKIVNPVTFSFSRFKLLNWILPSLVILAIGCQSNPKNDENPELESSTNSAFSKATIEDVEKGIRSYIDAQTRSGDGYFSIKDDSLSLNLRLVRVHTEYLSVLEPGRYFACVDLADTNGDVYDVDFFLSGDPDNMDVTETTVHKLNGKPYYAWKQSSDKTWRRVPVENASGELLGVIEGEDQFTFSYSAQLPEIIGPARLWMPLAQTDRFQRVTVTNVDAPTEYQTLTEERNGNSILFFELNPSHSGEIISINYDVKRLEKGPYQDSLPVNNIFRSSTPLMPTGGRFAEIVYDVLSEKQSESNLVQARALYDYVSDTVRYAKQGKYGTGDANFACDTRSGNCTEFHSLFISLARSADIPARFAIGAAIPSERNEGGVNGYHCWAEFYAEGKWWPVDISEGNKYAALSTYYFGHHPANRIELSRGRDLEVKPGPQSGPIPFFAYPILELDGKEVPVKTTFSFTRHKAS